MWCLLLKLGVRLALAAAALGAPGLQPAAAADAPPAARVSVEYFFEPGCAECLAVSNQVLPALRQRYGDFCELSLFDTGNKADYLRLVRYQEKFGPSKADGPVSMVVDGRFLLTGLAEIQTGLTARIDQCLGEWREEEEPEEADAVGGDVLAERARRWTVPIVMLAGFLDGINPCAISTLVFFVSLLSLARARARSILLMGFSFCAASFLTYTAIGFGLLRFIHLWTGFPMLRLVVEVGMVALLAVLAYLSFRDAWRYRHTGNPKDISLQLPEAIRDRIHAVIKKGMGFSSLALGGAAVGALVTALESVCTGQVYVPTLVFIVESRSTVWPGLSLLVVYNILFIMPLVLVFGLVYLGLRTEALMRWSRNNVVFSKTLLGFLFLALALALMALRSQTYLVTDRLL